MNLAKLRQEVCKANEINNLNANTRRAARQFKRIAVNDLGATESIIDNMFPRRRIRLEKSVLSDKWLAERASVKTDCYLFQKRTTQNP
jgi:hypothetical protein